MFGLCVEASHKRGMGNLFRTLNMIHWLENNHKDYVLMINEDERSNKYLDENNISYHIVDLWDYITNWESEQIQKYHITTWIDDRMATDLRHARFVKAEGCQLCSFDDTGDGSELVDKNFCSMVFEDISQLRGKRIYTGAKYMILNPEISTYRKIRHQKRNILVTLGGSDTYGVTLKVVDAIREADYEFTVVTGYCFNDTDLLKGIVKGSRIKLVKTVPSMIEFMSHFDVAVTGGGITSFESIASGMPCIIVANEHHEEQVGRFFKGKRCAEYLGFHENADYGRIVDTLNKMDINEMSENSLGLLDMCGLDNVMEEICDEQE